MVTLVFQETVLARYKDFTSDTRALHHALFTIESLRSKIDDGDTGLCSICSDIAVDAIFDRLPSYSLSGLADSSKNHSCRFCRFLVHLCTIALPWELLRRQEESNITICLLRDTIAWVSLGFDDLPAEYIGESARLELEMEEPIRLPFTPRNELLFTLRSNLYLRPWLIWKESLSQNQIALPLRQCELSDPLFDKFDPMVVRCWIVSCEESHKETCGSHLTENRFSETLTQTFKTRFIDVRTRKIVPADLNVYYIALSYVWGVPPASTSSSTAPSARNSLESYPRTVEDAIQVVKAIGIRFLWVDAYCINQYDLEDKQNQIRHMDLIYENAYLTIVALTGSSAEAGLPGVSVPFENIPQLRVKLGQDTLVATRLPEYQQIIDQSPWNTRAWTMQEAAL
jgi:hypothetical protein